MQTLTTVINKYDVDALTVSEHRINHSFIPASQTFATYFKTEVEPRSVSSHKVHKKPSTSHQQGDAAVMLTNTLIPYQEE